MSALASHPFRSSRLVFRAIDHDSATDQDVFLRIQQDTQGYRNSNAIPAVPQTKRHAAEFMKALVDTKILAVVICFCPDPSREEDLVPIGQVHLSSPTKGSLMSVHRHAEIGIDILPEYQGQGYGSEAIQWCLAWAFETGGFHRVMVRAFEWNEGARRLYERLGFRPEGRWREFLWFNGRFWDDFQFGMLESEWRQSQISQV